MTRDSAGPSNETDDAPPRLIDGRYAILAVVLLGLVSAIGSWLYHARLQRRAIAFWTPDTAALIQRAPNVAFLRLEPTETAAPDDSAEIMKIGGRPFLIASRIDASRIAGLIHLRHSLLQDGSFDWSTPQANCPPNWAYALQFAGDDGRATTIALDFSCDQLLLLDEDKRICMQPMAAGLKKFLSEQFTEPGDEQAPK